MSKKEDILQFKEINEIATKFREDLKTEKHVVLYAFNGTGKTRISMAFKEIGKQAGNDARDTIYFNAFTEDLFYWDNDLQADKERVLNINSASKFFAGFKELELDTRIRPFLHRYSDFDFVIDYEKWRVSFNKETRVTVEEDGQTKDTTEIIQNIKISRGEENIFIWCVFLAICQLAIDGAEAYKWVKYFYIDDPISSLDENNAIAVATDLTQLLINQNKNIKTVISTHHVLFFNVLYNELKQRSSVRYFLYKNATGSFFLKKTNDSPYFHHVASLSELNKAMLANDIKTYHFNILRSILEKTSSFFGYDSFGKCIHGVDDDVLFERALNLLSHGKYSVFEPVEMNEDNKELFKKILTAFLDKYAFELPKFLNEGT